VESNSIGGDFKQQLFNKTPISLGLSSLNVIYQNNAKKAESPIK
jgi:hypothetical protein